MSYRGSAFGLASLCLMLVVLCGGWTEAAAQTAGQSSRAMAYMYGDSATLTVTVLPLQAQVRLDGVLLGSAHDLVARSVSMLPGDHVVKIWAPGYLPSVLSVPGIPNWASHVNLALVPDRRP